MLEEVASLKLDYIFVVFLVLFGFLAFLVQQHAKLFLYYLKATFSPKLQTFQSDDTQSGRNVGFGLDLFAVLSFLSLIFISKSDLLEQRPMLMSLLVLYLVWGKRALVYFLSRLFEEDKLGAVHIAQLEVNNRVTGVILLPLVFISYYALPGNSIIFVYISLVFIILQFIVRFVKLLLTSFSHSEFPFYISIMYLCALEILPLLMFYKYFGR